MRHKGTTVVFAAVLMLLTGPAAQAAFVEDFSDGLTGWTTMGMDSAGGDVSVVAEAACLADGLDWYSALWQPVSLAPGDYRIEFDVLGSLSADPGQGFGPDAFFASLYFADDPSAFDPWSLSFDDAMPLFDLDAAGPYNVEGTISQSALGGDWLHFAMDFTNSYLYAIPTFELFDANYVYGDSSVCVDNVVIAKCDQDAPVPEPASVIVLTLGLLGIAGRTARRSLSLPKA